MDADVIADIRRFNRRYTNILGVLNRYVLDTGYSFTEARVMIEIGLMGPCIANTLVDLLNIDRSYMSRIVNKLCKDGLLVKESSSSDQRSSLLRLTTAGMEFYNQLNERSDEQIIRLFAGLPDKEMKEFHASIMSIQKKLDKLERTETTG
ncbi:MarR family winged helix-turn-helix transcriptional regulator [Paenibacillus sp. P96]|uniref:MarR family winged helix-turn-helix transcriptional regulator n=1 Tax=Paenibacillus zeirhizosphaerae TaxID=2987519 RepID=A0ABT9FNP8_9BACL|nr:MarR family winged helix-turn-helix transcriptional regulator [Paenibacillus sp. P96]MDP4096343.1 MarR family winged helix-turn-helix transcriptional regulator [Paenibacillus sp. P96]